MTEQWGAPLTGAQMNLLRAAGLPDCDHHVVSPMVWGAPYEERAKLDRYFLPADHLAYTLLKAGWLDGRNVRLWFGDEAPDDWRGGSDVLLSSGRTCCASFVHNWKDFGGIIAYIAKDECSHVGNIVELPGFEGFQCSACGKVAGRLEVDLARLGRAPRMEVTADTIDPSKVPPVQHIAPQPETVTLEKMTPSQIEERLDIPPLEKHRSAYGRGGWDVLEKLGLIKPEPTRAERFTAETGIPATPEILQALEFEQ